MTQPQIEASQGGVTLGAASEVVTIPLAADHVFSVPTTKGLIVVGPSGGGAIRCRLRDDEADITLPVPEGVFFMPVQLRIVRMAGTTATSIIGLLA